MIVSRDASLGAACADELAAVLGTGSDVRRVSAASELGAIADPVDVLVAVPQQPIAGSSHQPDQSAFAAEVQAAVAAVLPGMVERGHGRVVVVVTATGLPGQSWADGTGSAMWSLVGLARTAAREVAAAGVTVNVVRTGLVDDAATRAAVADDAAVADAVAATQRLAPIRRTVTPDDIAAAVGYLVSDDAAYVTGIVLPVDGGLTIGQGT